MSTQTNEICITRFTAWVESQRKLSFERYRVSLHRGLATQKRDSLTQQALVDTVETLFHDALQKIYELPFDARDVPLQRGWSALALRVLAPFQGFCEALLDEALRFNRTSCAMSNFADEHLPSVDYQKAIHRDLAAAWKDFALTVNALLVDTSQQSVAA
jgi:monoamine oxidase